MGELHSLTDWQVSEASEDAELEDFCVPGAGGEEKRRSAKCSHHPGVQQHPQPPGPQPAAADAGRRAGSDLARSQGDAGTLSPNLIPSPRGHKGRGEGPCGVGTPRGSRRDGDAGGSQSILGAGEDAGRRGSSAPRCLVGDWHKLGVLGRWRKYPSAPARGREISVPHPGVGSQMGFLCSVAPEKGWHSPVFPIFLSRDATSNGNMPWGGGPITSTPDPCVVPILQKGKLRPGGGRR